MSDRPKDAEAQGGEQLFKNMDEQERIYAPEEVPGTTLPPEEVDAGGTAASGTALPESDQRTVPVAGPLPTAGSTQPVPVPVRAPTESEGEGPRDEEDRRRE
jgi:hypothetical protein